MIKKPSLVFICKTYRGDIQSFTRLYRTYKQHNIDNIPLYISVPETDRYLFQEKVKVEDNVVIISDESYAEEYFTNEEYWGLSKGYINQEICKLSFWETGIARNYLCIDSDVYFIRDFYLTDFMANKETPYSVLVMDKDLQVQPFYNEFGKWRHDLIKKIFHTVGYEDRRYLTCHGMTVLNSKVLKDLKENFMKKHNFGYKDLIRISPYEYTWYNVWLQKSKIIDIYAVEPFFKTFHMREEYEMSRVSLITELLLAEQYVGIIMNSNWKPIPPPDKYQNPGRLEVFIHKFIGRLH